MPRENRERIRRLDELHRFLHQSNISGQNPKRLAALRTRADPEVATLAALILDVARVLPGQRSRWLKLARRHRPMFERAVGVLGLDYFGQLLAGDGDFESPLWDIVEEYRMTPPWTARACDCGSGRAYRDCCLERENDLLDGPES